MELGKTSLPRVPQKYNIDVFEDFECPDGVNPLLFFQLCIYYYTDVVQAVVNEIQDEDGLVYTEEITRNKKGNIINKKHQNFVRVTSQQHNDNRYQQLTYLCAWQLNNYGTRQIIKASSQRVVYGRVSCTQQFTIWCCSKSQLCYTQGRTCGSDTS